MFIIGQNTLKTYVIEHGYMTKMVTVTESHDTYMDIIVSTINVFQIMGHPYECLSPFFSQITGHPYGFYCAIGEIKSHDTHMDIFVALIRIWMLNN